MKKLLLASAVAALSVSVSQAAPTIYGNVFVSADYVNATTDRQLAANERVRNSSTGYDENEAEINSNSSRLGFKGSEAISANTDVVYQLEYEFGVDGDKRGFESRDTYLGLANKDFGELRVGRNTSVLYYVNNVSVLEGYWDNLDDSRFESKNDLKALTIMLDHTRQNNSVVWIAPKHDDLPLELALQYVSNEKSEDLDNGFGASLMFDQDAGFTAGLAYSKNMGINGEIEFLDKTNPDKSKSKEFRYGGDVIRGTATVDLGKYAAVPVTLGALYQQADYDFAGSEKEKGLVISGEMDLMSFAKPASIYLQYNKTDNLNGFRDSNSDQIVLGGKYKFKKNITAHAYVGQNSADYVAIGKINKINKKGNEKFERYAKVESDIDIFAVGGGLEYKF